MSDLIGIYNNACAFYDCAQMCIQKADDGQPYEYLRLHTPALVNCAFSCELFLKLLIESVGKDYGKIHDLDKLFNLLPQDMQERINKNTYYKTGMFKDAFGIPMLKKVANSFNEWHYSFEKRQLSGYIGYLLGLCAVLKDEADKLYIH